MMVTRITVAADQRTTQNFQMHAHESTTLKAVVVTTYKKPLVDIDRPGAMIITNHNLRSLPTTDIQDAVGLAPALYQSQRGSNTTAGRRTERKTATTGFLNPSLPEYRRYAENDFMNVEANPLSTMSVDVDRASYTNIRRIINEGGKPPVDAVRIEEMINYFDYDYAQPEYNNPIAIHTELTRCPWREENLLLRIGIQAMKTDASELPASNIVFLVDVSGSMSGPERLPLLKSGLRLLVNTLRQKDIVSIVTYAGAAGLALPPTPGSNKRAILAVLDRLESGGSTAGGAGIMLAYKTAKDNFIKGGNNRVILATDGDFNVGVSSDNELEALIVKRRETGVFLTCLGVGTDNYKDAKLEILADKGNGNYHYIDNLKEAQKALVGEFGGTLFTVAKDVKAQIEFNPAQVQGYRLLGYENRLLNEEDFKDDKKDAGDMGAGHTVTILYEIIPTGIHSNLLRKTRKLKYRQQKAVAGNYDNEFATIRFRYKQPDGEKSKEIAHIIDNTITDWNKASDNTKFATSVAMFGMILKNSQYKGVTSYDDVINMATADKGTDKNGLRAEFVGLVEAMNAYDAKVQVK